MLNHDETKACILGENEEIRNMETVGTDRAHVKKKPKHKSKKAVAVQKNKLQRSLHVCA